MKNLSYLSHNFSIRICNHKRNVSMPLITTRVSLFAKVRNDLTGAQHNIFANFATKTFLTYGILFSDRIFVDVQKFLHFQIQVYWTKMKTIKCTVVGDHGVGKGSLLRTFVNGGSFREEAEPIIFDNFLVTSLVDKRQCQLTLWYANGMEEYDRLRPLSYPGTHIVLLCFSIDDISSFYNVKDKWIPEMTHYCPNSPILLVGLKIDLRVNEKFLESRGQIDSDDHLITYEEGVALSTEIGAIRYMEVSSMKNYGIHELFEEAVRTAFLMCDFEENQQKCKGGCTIF